MTFPSLLRSQIFPCKQNKDRIHLFILLWLLIVAPVLSQTVSPNETLNLKPLPINTTTFPPFVPRKRVHLPQGFQSGPPEIWNVTILSHSTGNISLDSAAGAHFNFSNTDKRNMLPSNIRLSKKFRVPTIPRFFDVAVPGTFFGMFVNRGPRYDRNVVGQIITAVWAGITDLINHDFQGDGDIPIMEPEVFPALDNNNHNWYMSILAVNGNIVTWNDFRAACAALHNIMFTQGVAAAARWRLYNLQTGEVVAEGTFDRGPHPVEVWVLDEL